MSDKVYQNAKMSKVLFLMMEGGVEEYKGKTQEEINIDLTLIDNQEDIGNFECEMPSTPGNYKVKKKIAKEKTIKRESWSITQKIYIADFFLATLNFKKAPTEREVTQFSDKYLELFKEKKWSSIKT